MTFGKLPTRSKNSDIKANVTLELTLYDIKTKSTSYLGSLFINYNLEHMAD